MNITAESYGHAVVLNMKGEFTEDALSAVRREVQHQLGGRDVADLVLNLEKVPFVDSAGLEFLLDLQERLSEKFGQVRLAKPDENVRKILEVTRLESEFEIHEDITEAVKAIQV
jgi:anti-anti-sigma factor